MKNTKTIEDVRKEIRQHHLFKRLLANEDFREWYKAEMIDDAEKYCVMVAESNLSSYDRAMSSGIIRFVRRKWAEITTVGSPQRLKQLKKHSEVLNGRERKKEPGPEQLPYGTF